MRNKGSHVNEDNPELAALIEALSEWLDGLIDALSGFIQEYDLIMGDLRSKSDGRNDRAHWEEQRQAHQARKIRARRDKRPKYHRRMERGRRG